ncbi:MAG: NUDIX domain-containing protein [Coriobacteriales bacterium]|nr:NUDIX domain-containing protein [Coriobacteriales bacterium]
MNQDMCVPCGEGILNIRVGAIILKDGHFLMVRNDKNDYYYSVGGRIKFGETAQEAVVREVYEETGVRMDIDHLGFVLENYFIADEQEKLGKEVYELAFFFYMKMPKDFEPVCYSFTEDDHKEYLEWVSPNEPKTIYPEFFRTDLDINDKSIKHRVYDDRPNTAKITEGDR